MTDIIMAVDDTGLLHPGDSMSGSGTLRGKEIRIVAADAAHTHVVRALMASTGPGYGYFVVTLADPLMDHSLTGSFTPDTPSVFSIRSRRGFEGAA